MCKLGKLYFLDLKGWSIFDQLRLEEALLRCGRENYFLLNSNASASVVLGLSNRLEDLVDLPRAKSLNLPIYRRFSGGGAVVVDEDTIFATFIFGKDALPCESTPDAFITFGADIFSKAFFPHKLQVFEQDYALYGMKIGGSAESFTKDRALHHTSFLYSWNERLMQVLKMPKKQPEYRQSREHKDFCGRLEAYFSDKQVCRQLLTNVVLDSFDCESIVPDDLEVMCALPHRQSVEILYQSQNRARVNFLKNVQELLSPLNCPIGSYIISGSGPMAMRNMREAADIDIIVNAPLWNSLIQKYEAIGATKNRIAIGRLEIWKDWMNLTEKIDEMIENCEMIGGLPFMKLPYVIEWKQHLGRPKDLLDIAMIKNYFQKERFR